MGIARAKGAKGKCDALFSRIIRAVGHCERCSSTNFLQCAHIISRRYSATRCNLMNAWCLCAGCHRRLTDWPVEHYEFIEKTIGVDAYEQMKLMAEQSTKMDWDAELERLKQIAKEGDIK